MAISQKVFKQLPCPLSPPTKHDISSCDLPQIVFPFDEAFVKDKKRKKELILAKILVVNFRDSARVQNQNIEKLADYIDGIIDDHSFEILRAGELNEEYFSLVEKIASQHGLPARKNNKNGDHLLSFSSKFCANHNQKAPFYDTYAWNLLNYWLIDLGFKMKWHDYKNYVEALIKLQKHQHLEDFFLRHIEYYVWELAKEIEQLISCYGLGLPLLAVLQRRQWTFLSQNKPFLPR